VSFMVILLDVWVLDCWICSSRIDVAD